MYKKTITSILSNLSKIGASLTEKQLIDLKWRMSPDAQKYYTREQTNKFYKALRRGNTTVIDLIRKEKQEMIQKLKTKFKLS